MLPLILGGLGAAANISQAYQDRAQARKDRELKAATAAYRPWTGLDPNGVEITKANNNLVAGLGGFTSGAKAGGELSSAFGSSTPQSPGLGSAAAASKSIDNQIANMGSAEDFQMPQGSPQSPYSLAAAEHKESPWTLYGKKNSSRFSLS
jgi:hypothetical protein